MTSQNGTKINIELTREQVIKLRVYIDLTEQYLKDEQKSWSEMSTEVDENGNVKYQHAKSNADCLAEVIEAIDDIQRIL